MVKNISLRNIQGKNSRMAARHRRQTRDGGEGLILQGSQHLRDVD